MEKNTGPREESNDLSIVREALRQTELRLEDCNGLASNADQRAMALSAAAAAFATALAASAGSFPAPFWTYVASAGLLFSCFVSIGSCMPRDFHVRGHYWRDWKGHIDDSDDLMDVLASQAEENDTRIITNDAALRRAAKLQKIAFLLLFCSLCFFSAVQAASFSLCRSIE